MQLIPQGQSSTLGTPQGCGGCFIPYTQSRPSRESDNLPAAQQVSWQSGRLFSLPSQNLDYFFLPYFQHVSSENQCNTKKMPLPDSSSKSGVYPCLATAISLRSWLQLDVLNYTHITLDQRYFASIYPKPKQGIQSSKKEIILCLLAFRLGEQQKQIAPPPFRYNTKYL